MATPLALQLTATKLRSRFLRACELKQTVNWEEILHNFQKWAAVMKFDAPLIVRIEGIEQYRRALKVSRAAISSLHLRSAGSEESSWTSRAIRETSAARDTRVVKDMIRSAPNLCAARAASRKTSLGPVGFAEMQARQLLFPAKTVWDIPWLAIIAIGALEFGNATEFFRWYPLFEAFEAGAYCFVFTEHSIEICALPSVVKVDGQNRLHSESGPAFVWLNDIRDYYWHGVHVESHVVEQPELITVADIEAETTDLVCKTKIERLGQVRPNITLPRFPPATANELKERYLRACELKRTVNWEKIVVCFRRWAAAFKIDVSTIVRLETVEQVRNAASRGFHVEKTSRAYSTISEQGITNARLESSTYASWDQSALRSEHQALALREIIAFDAASPRNAERLVMAERHEKYSIFCRKQVIASAASAANAERTRRIEPAVQAARRVWESGWDVTLNAITAINNLEQVYQGSDFSSWYPLFEAYEAGAFCFHITGCGIETCTLPSMVKVDDHNRLHSAAGPAFVWLNDVRDYYWHGVQVKPYVVDNPERITTADIEGETNVEVRRVKIERFGQARYLLDSGAQEIHQDDFGTLYRKEVPGDEPLVMVKVVNATSEPDSSFKDYFLRVPPAMRTAREAVAWTFGKTPADYQPQQET